MERREFLNGTLVGLAGLVASVKLAKAEDLKLLVPQHDVQLYQTIPSPKAATVAWPDPFGGDGMLYMKDRDGHYHELGRVTEIELRRMVDEVDQFDASFRSYRPTPEIHGRVRGLVEGLSTTLLVRK